MENLDLQIPIVPPRLRLLHLDALLKLLQLQPHNGVVHCYVSIVLKEA